MTGVSVSNLGVRIGDAQILSAVSFRVESGRMVAVIGPNGSGKSTLLRAMSSGRRPRCGEVMVGDKTLTATTRRERAAMMSYVEQESVIGANVTARDVVALGRLPLQRRWSFDTTVDDDEIKAALALVNASSLADRRWDSLSGGERQRVQLARAVAQETDVLLLDEPTNHLDVKHQLEFLATVRTMRLTTIAAIHDLTLVGMFFDDVVVLQNGEVRAAGAVRDVLTAPLVADVFGVEADIRIARDMVRIDLVRSLG